MSQEITFTDSHGGRTREVTMFLIDFADLCIENFSVIVYILELVYNLRKGKYLSEGLVPSVIFSKEQYEVRKNGSKKIGRNEACPCGSGKKYKRCCL